MVVGRILLEYFVDRAEELEILQKNTLALIEGTFKNFVLINPRRMGKTFLIEKHVHEINSDDRFKKVIPVYINCQTTISWENLMDRLMDTAYEEYAKKSRDMLIKRRLSEMFKEWAKIFKRIEHLEGEVGTATGEYLKARITFQQEKEQGNVLELIEKALGAMEELAFKKDVFFEVYLDEFQQVRKFKIFQDVLATMREALQRQKRITYILSGSSVSFMEELYTKESSAFFKQLTPISLSFLRESDIKEYLKLRKRNYTEDGVKALVEITRGIPDYIAKIVDELEVIDVKTVRETFDRIIQREAKTYAEIYDGLRINQQKAAVTIAKGKTSYKELEEVIGRESAGAVLSNMIVNGQLYKVSIGTYDIYDVGLKRYIQLMLEEGYL